MPIHYTLDPDHENLIISTITLPFDPILDPQAALKELATFLGNISGTIGILSDLRGLDISFTEIIIGMASVAFNEQSPLRSGRFIIAQVADHDVYETITEWFKDDLYGALSVPTFKTVDDAKSYLLLHLSADPD